jgi:predicted ATP-dependent Lon-type protease
MRRRYTDEQLGVILEFLLEATRRQREASAKLTSGVFLEEGQSAVDRSACV